MNIRMSKLLDERWVRAIAIAGFIALMGYMVGKLTLDPSKVRLLLASAFILILMSFSLRKPQISLYMLLFFLPMLGFIRRTLIPVAGWNSLDPLVLVSPAIAFLLVFHWFYLTYIRRTAAVTYTPLFRMIVWMLIVDCIQIFNPAQGSLFTGFAGVLFYIVPMCYYFVGREYLDAKRMKFILATVYSIGLLVALYGYKQYYFGYYSFEEMWVEISGYTALKVYNIMRPISSFSSASEYAFYLAIAIVIGWVYVLRSKGGLKIVGLLGTVFLYSALFVESARGAIVTVTLALVVISILHARKLSNKIAITIIASLVLTGLFIGMSKLNTTNDLIYHSVIGLTDPLGEQSTTIGHVDRMFEGFIKGFSSPLGHGLGSTTIAAGKFNSASVSSEVDLSNQFIATGFVGGILYLISMIIILKLAIQHARRSAIHLTILGVLIAQAGQWLNGGHYSTVVLIWLLIGFLDKSTLQKEE
ncbi:MAG: hypothetical protein P0Y55_02275 [Candidatus Cohnella colombiensis]|uniref:O-antigen ligase domain-containing protein n=1 Tax=Candidatus Cohnella colombiensis TaxID=3121368 RepID=A0AA95EXV1_9BACL|nr:MAG: hypothetical protein P0Y55_02275 [Cohnella sp.]